MRLTKTLWTILGAAVIVAAAVTLFMLYQGQMKQQDELNDSLGAAYNRLQLLTIEKGSLQADIAQLQADITQQHDETGLLQDEIEQLEDELQQLEDERAEAEALALQLLSQAKASFIASAESIEYDEILFAFAQDANLNLWNIEASSPAQLSIEGIEYKATVITMNVGGQATDILDFINTVVTYEAFKTSIVRDFSMSMPKPLSQDEIDMLEKSIRAQFYNEAVGQITTEQMVGFITEAIAEVTGPDSDWPDPVVTEAVADMAQVIKGKLNQMVETGIYDPLSGDLAQMIEESIAGALVDTIIRPLAEQIAALIVGEGDDGFAESDLLELLGEDITELMGDDIAGSLEGNIGNLLVGYVSSLIDQKVAASVAGLVDSQTAAQLAVTIEQLETPSSDITLTIYTYEGD